MISNTPNYTMEYLSERVSISHDKLRGILKSAEISSKEIRERSNKKCKKLIFDDTVLDKRYSKEIELAKHLWDNCEKRVIEGIGLISAISVNEMNEFDLADYRLYDKINDGKTKNDHFQDMLRESDAEEIYFDCWYATRDNLKLINELEKKFYCGIKENRIVFDSGGNRKHVSEIKDEELVSIKGLNFKVRIFHKADKNDRDEYYATNEIELTKDKFNEKRKIRWKVEEYHREIKQLTGIEKCQARLRQIQKNHIGCCLMAWQFLKKKAYELKTTIYHLWERQSHEFISHQIFNPLFSFA